MEERIDVRAVLEGEEAEIWSAIKKFYGLKTNPELIRLMMVRFYRHIEGEIEKGKDKFHP